MVESMESQRVGHDWVTFPFTFINRYESSAQFSHSVMSDSLQPHELQPARLLCPWDSPGKNTGVDFYVLLQGIFLVQGLNLGHELKLKWSLQLVIAIV